MDALSFMVREDLVTETNIRQHLRDKRVGFIELSLSMVEFLKIRLMNWSSYRHMLLGELFY